jgi:hypothetical protein
MQCPICGKDGSCQAFFNSQGKLKYARLRHYSHTDKESRKPQFTYCKITDLDALETLLLNKGIQLSTDKAASGQIGQISNTKIHDLKLKDSSSNCQNKWAGSSVRIEHHPPKVGVVGSNPTPPVGDAPRTVFGDSGWLLAFS